MNARLACKATRYCAKALVSLIAALSSHVAHFTSFWDHRSRYLMALRGLQVNYKILNCLYLSISISRRSGDCCNGILEVKLILLNGVKRK